MAKIVTCCSCKERFPKEEMTYYTSMGAQAGHYYCKPCLDEKLAREHFSLTVCEIFGLKSPGPRIWTERKRLREKLGYTDALIIECLRYLYTVEKKRKLSESICLVTPAAIARMLEYKEAMRVENNNLDNTVANNIIVKPIKIKTTKKEKKILSFDDVLE